jgi:hypothetical protein
LLKSSVKSFVKASVKAIEGSLKAREARVPLAAKRPSPPMSFGIRDRKQPDSQLFLNHQEMRATGQRMERLI